MLSAKGNLSQRKAGESAGKFLLYEMCNLKKNAYFLIIWTKKNHPNSYNVSPSHPPLYYHRGLCIHGLCKVI